MDVRLVLLISCLTICNCESNHLQSRPNAVNNECHLYNAIKSEMVSARQLLMNLQQDMKSGIEEIRQIVTQKQIEEIPQINLKQQNFSETQDVQEFQVKFEEIYQVMIEQKKFNEEIRQIIFRQKDNESQATREIKSEIEEIRQIMFKMHNNETQATQEIKWKLEDFRQILFKQHGNETQTLKDMKSETEEIRRSIHIQYDNETQAMKEMKSKSEEIRQIILNHAGNETRTMQEMLSKSGEIREIVLQQHRHETQAMREMKSMSEEIRQIMVKQYANETRAAHEAKLRMAEIHQIMLKHHGNETQAMKEMKSKMDEIRQTVIQQQNRPREECPFGFDYLPEAASCFTIIFKEMSWYSATARCRAIMSGAHLAAIKSQAESDAIVTYLRAQFIRTGVRSSGVSDWCPNGYLVWTSGQTKTGRCRNSGNPFTWKTLNGIEIPFSYTNWGRGEPNCAGDEGCVHIASCLNHAWNDYRCQSSSFPLCQISL